MPLYIPWLTETIKKRGVRYLLHHYLGQFFEEKLTLEQLSIDIYEGKGSIKNLFLDVNGLNDELDFVPFKFLDGCLIGQISVEVPWSSLATDACKVELDGANFVCRLKTSADGTKAHCTESTLLTRSLMTSSMQMAEDIVTTEDDDDLDSLTSSTYRYNNQSPSQDNDNKKKKKDANKMFEGLEMFAQLIDSVLRRTKLTARNTLFQIQPHPDNEEENSDFKLSSPTSSSSVNDGYRSTSDDFSDPASKSESNSNYGTSNNNNTVEFFIQYFRCEEVIDESSENHLDAKSDKNEEYKSNKPLNAMPETITKLLTLEDVEMRIGGVPVSNLIGKHTIMIKFNGQKSEIFIFSGSPLLAVINHEQLKTFFNVFDSTKDNDSSPTDAKNQQVLSAEDYAKIENQLLESASMRNRGDLSEFGYVGANRFGSQSGRRWLDSGELYSNTSRRGESDFDYHSPNTSSTATCPDGKTESEPTLDNIEAFSCELKLPGIWLCILKDGEALPPLIKPYADSINSFQTINDYIEERIKVPHIRLLALKVALDITSAGINIFLGDLDISEHLQDDSVSPTLNLFQNDSANQPMNSARYKASIINGKDISIDFLATTRVIFDPTMIDRIVYDYKLIDLDTDYRNSERSNDASRQTDLNLTIKGDQFKVELLCPIPDLTPEAHLKPTQLRPQSFLFDFKNIVLTWQSDKLSATVSDLVASVKTQPRQTDTEAIKFIESSGKGSDKIVLTLEPSPSSLDNAFPSDIDRVLNESSMYDSIYIGQATESQIPTGAFQTKRKVVRGSFQDEVERKQDSDSKTNDRDNEKIITSGDRQHLLDFLEQTVSNTKLSLTLHLPVCEVEFEDKEQLDLIYNRFGNDFVFWQPKAFTKKKLDSSGTNHSLKRLDINDRKPDREMPSFKRSAEDSDSDITSDRESEISYHSLNIDKYSSDLYTNQTTCKIMVAELFVKFNHQNCAAALKQEISAENLLLGVVIDVDKKPNTIISFVADNLELCTESETVLEGNSYGDKNSTFGFTTEIRRPTKALKDIKLAIQLVNGLFDDFKLATYTRFWQSINVTDEPILGYVAPKIVTELHINILNTALSLAREGVRPALLTIDELYLTSMVMEKTSQIMIRFIADEVSLYLKRNKQGLEIMKNYICLVDSGLVDLNVKFSEDGKLEFGVINNVITVRVCQDSLSALCKLFNILIKSSNSSGVETTAPNAEEDYVQRDDPSSNLEQGNANYVPQKISDHLDVTDMGNQDMVRVDETSRNTMIEREKNLLKDAMNDYDDTSDETNVCEPQRSSERESNSNDENNDDDDTSSNSANELGNQVRERDPYASILDESNPSIGDLFTPPLLPSSTIQPQSNDSEEHPKSNNKAIDESGFFVIGDDDVGAGIIDRQQSEPVVRRLTNKPLNIIENHFKMTRPRTIPDILASSLERYVLEEMTLVVNLYGGKDFDDENTDETESSTTTTNTTSDDPEVEILDNLSIDSGSIRSRTSSITSVKKSPLVNKANSSDSSSLLKKRTGGRRKYLSENSRDQYKVSPAVESRVRFGDGAVNLWESLDLMSSPDFLGSCRRPSNQPANSDSKLAGGTWRQNDVCIQLTLTKVKLLYEIADQSSPISWRFMLFIQDIEIKDKIQASDINKLLYEYCTETMPKRDTQILTIKNIATINPSDGCEECDLRVSLKPLRLNIDQDTLLFLIEFFTAFAKSIGRQKSQPPPSTSAGSMNDTTSHNQPDASPTGSLVANKQQPGREFLSTTPTAGGKRADGYVKAQGQQRNLPSRYSQTNSSDENRRKGQTIEKDETAIYGSPASRGSFSPDSSSRPNTSANLHSSSLSTPLSGSDKNCSATTTTVTTSTSRSGRRIRQDNDKKVGDWGALECNQELGGGGEASAQTETKLGKHSQDAMSDSDNDEYVESSSDLPMHCHKDTSGAANQQHSIYIKSFTFSPDVPIRLDYHAKHLDFEQGALAGILMGLTHLDHSELVLRRVQAKHGMRGLDRVLLFTLNSWLSDIKRNQLPSILSGVGPMHSFIQLFQGMRDLIWMPIDHYRKDRRLVRGLQRGASSFSSSTAMAAINLVNRFISIVQCTAQIAHDIVTPPTFHTTSSSPSPSTSSSALSSSHGPNNRRRSKLASRVSNSLASGRTLSSGLVSSPNSVAALNQPRNFGEGLAVGFTILKEGFNDTARNVAVGMQAEDMRSAVGELVRQIPSTLLNPIILATEGAQNVLVGIRNQIAPDARREDQEKWKRRVRGK